MTSLHGKVVLIVGGSRGVGLATARQVAQEGAGIVLFGRDARRLDAASAAVREAGARWVLSVAGDLGRPEDLTRLAAEVEDRGPLDAVFCSAGFAPFAPLADCDPAFVQRALAVNLAGPIELARVLAPRLRDGGSALFTASGMHHRPLAHAAVWAASTTAVVGFARALAVEWAARRIRVNAISHGPVDTPIYEDYGMPAEAVRAMKQDLGGKTLVGRMAHPDEVAKVALELLRPEGFVTGTEVVVDGGWSLGAP